MSRLSTVERVGIPLTALPAVVRSPDPSGSADEWRRGRVWTTRFASSTDDAQLFDTSNLTYTTDGSDTIVTPTATGSLASFLTKVRLRNFEVRLNYKLVTVAGVNVVYCAGRWFDVNNRAIESLDANNSGGFLWLRSMVGGVSGTATLEFVSKATLGVDNTDQAIWRWMALRVVDDLCLAKMWAEGTAEPDWQLVRRSRPHGGEGIVDTSTSTDNPPPGPCGFALLNTAAHARSLSVTELHHASPSVLVNSTLRHVESAGAARPAFWYPNRALVTGETVASASVADHAGRTRPVLRVVAPGGTSPGPGWEQVTFARPAPSNGFTRLLPEPQRALGPELEVTIWSKGTNVANPSPTSLYGNKGLAASLVVKYYRAGDGVELGQFEDGPQPGADGVGGHVHYTYLGPNVGGTGTWDWYPTRVRIQVVEWWRVVWLTWFIGLHDQAASGTLDVEVPWAVVVP